MNLYFRSAALLLAVAGITFHASAQDGGHLSGDLQLNANFFQRDTTIGAANNPLYDNLLSGGENWLTLRYNNYGYTGFLRIDAFRNSNLRNPTQPSTGFGIGAFSLSKTVKNLEITGGYIYDQIGSGIIFRAYEDRGLLIDNALVGARLKYNIGDNFSIKAMSGQQKNLFERYQPIISAVNAEGFISFKDKVFLTPGIGVLNRTLDQESIDQVVTRVNNLPVGERFSPPYNMYAFSAYNTLTAGDFSWYIEGAYKTEEAQNDYNGKLFNSAGNIVFTTLNYARKGLGLTLTGKRTENFTMRTSPSQSLLNGMINWQPIIAQIRPQRLIARYSPASQDLSEIGGSANLLISPSLEYDFSLSYTHINTLESTKLYREIYAEANIRSVENFLIDVGVQVLEYNQEFYQNKPGVGIVKAVTPFTEITYRLPKQKSVKLQAQYMSTKQDYGSWLYIGLEYAIAPRWSFALNDMYNIKPARPGDDGQHYYNAFVAYTAGANRFTFSYAKQVEGVNCTGGVCRYEPAFSGVRVGITSSF